MPTLLYEKNLGDIDALYWIEGEHGDVGLELVPSNWKSRRQNKRQVVDPLVQIMLRGDDFPFGFAAGHTMRNSGSLARFRFDRQQVLEDDVKKCVITYFVGQNGLAIQHHLTHFFGEQGVEIQTVFENTGEAPVILEMLSSFSLAGITPFVSSDAAESMILHRLRSKWSNEGLLSSVPIEDLQLEPTWSGHGAFSEKFGQVGSMPVRRFFPFAAIEDRINNVTWGAQLDSPASWQMEVYRKDDGICLSGGLADFDFGHWAKCIKPGESFTAPTAYMSVCHGNLDTLCARLTRMHKRALSKMTLPPRLPVIFNEFCSTWGNPSQQKLEEMLPALKGKDIDYFVIDSGWYADSDKGWEMNMGDWQVNTDQFPKGLGAAAEAIREAGMLPGIWFEPEICGCSAKAFQQTDHLLKRFGTPITAGYRRFWNMCDPWVREDLRRKVIAPLAEHGFTYVKIDYNETMGVGCDHVDGLGEGLRQSMAASRDFLCEIRARVPGIIVENCSSGGHRLEPSFLSICQLASFSDSHEERELPIIAANLHRAMLPEQSLIWAVLRASDSRQRLIWSLCSTFLGVMCLSGDVEALKPSQWEAVEQGIAFYRQASAVIRDGITIRHGPKVCSYRHPKGWQAVERTSMDGGQKLIVAHVFDDASGRFALDIGESYTLRTCYIEQDDAVSYADGVLHVNLPRDSAFAILLDKNEK